MKVKAKQKEYSKPLSYTHMSYITYCKLYKLYTIYRVFIVIHITNISIIYIYDMKEQYNIYEYLHIFLSKQIEEINIKKCEIYK